MENTELENMVDRTDLSKVVNDLIEICHAKAEHLRSNWQDEQAARLWEKSAKALEQANGKIPVYPGIG